MQQRLLYLFVFLFFAAGSYAQQSDRVVDERGNLVYQYNRTITADTKKPNRMVVSFVFINGNSRRAICYRQETFSSEFMWLATNGGDTCKDKKVEMITENLLPNQAITWQFYYTAVPNRQTGMALLEKAALMIMKDDFDVIKIVIPVESYRP